VRGIGGSWISEDTLYAVLADQVDYIAEVRFVDFWFVGIESQVPGRYTKLIVQVPELAFRVDASTEVLAAAENVSVANL